MAMTFTDTEEEMLIKIVSRYPAIYDVNHADYRSLEVKENVWQNIGKELNKSSEECRKKWKFVRDCYNRFKKKHKAGTTSVPKNSKDHRHQQLSFLDTVHRSHESKTNSPHESMEHDDTSDSFNYEKQIKNPINIEITKMEALSDEEECIEAEQNYQPTEPNIQNRSDLINRWKRKTDRTQKFYKTSVIKKDDDVDFFCRHIAEVLRNLPPVQKAEAKKDLSMVLSEYEILAAKLATECSPTSSPNNIVDNFSTHSYSDCQVNILGSDNII